MRGKEAAPAVTGAAPAVDGVAPAVDGTVPAVDGTAEDGAAAVGRRATNERSATNGMTALRWWMKTPPRARRIPIG